MNEYDNEPIRGLPADLPAGEHILWQGEPGTASMARRVFHAHKASLYFALLIGLNLALTTAAGRPLAEALQSSLWQAGLALAGVGLLWLLAWLYARSTVYTITNQRIVIRFGVAIPLMINIPLDKVESADLQQYGKGEGNILLHTRSKARISYWSLWPHVRPWHFSQVQPMLRGLDDPAKVAELLAAAVDADAAAAPAARPQRSGLSRASAGGELALS